LEDYALLLDPLIGLLPRGINGPVEERLQISALTTVRLSMRWSRMKDGGPRQYGALEWIFRRFT
jgi:hypothetical protein